MAHFSFLFLYFSILAFSISVYFLYFPSVIVRSLVPIILKYLLIHLPPPISNQSPSLAGLLPSWAAFLTRVSVSRGHLPQSSRPNGFWTELFRKEGGKKRSQINTNIYIYIFFNNIQFGPGYGKMGMFINSQEKCIFVQCFCLKYDAQFLFIQYSQ